MFQWLRLRRDRRPADSDPDNRRAAGARVESAVSEWLAKQGCRELARNYQVRGGELDLIVQSDGMLAFVEVRYRLHGGIQAALESVGRHKRQRLIRAARRFLQQHRALQSQPCRFDVVAVEGDPAAYRYQWIKDAFRVDD